MPVPFIRPSLPAEYKPSTCSLHTDASTVFRKHLTPFEQRGIKQHKEVWCLGIAEEKVQETFPLRHGYDDRKGHYKMVNTDRCPPEGSYHKPFRVEEWALLGSDRCIYFIHIWFSKL